MKNLSLILLLDILTYKLLQVYSQISFFNRMHYFYFLLALRQLYKVEFLIMRIVVKAGKDLPLLENMTAIELYTKMKFVYRNGIYTVNTTPEMKEHYLVLLEYRKKLNSFLKRLNN